MTDVTDYADEIKWRRRIVEHARSWIGTPYQHQASVVGRGCDCLGLVRGVWREMLGAEPVAALDYSPSWGEVAHEEVLQSALQKYFEPETLDPTRSGCVISFRIHKRSIVKHIAITMGCVNDQPQMIHSYNNNGVVLSPLNAAWIRRCAGQYSFPRRIV
jgi:NlpC/P60 family putative phage cell wall peptidase